eukprot:TRINITY_DN14653_c0_g1_i3.p1 TRINITY_DN14653_c0_g1~~TRINITY_DN14653_c0_g1_i3.p1  ORF type:complete len:418 (-),score=73.67 TRINITY_DN14653_c0_g1_i3:20-1273(-)
MGLQKLHDHSTAHGWAWEISFKEPPMRRARGGAQPTSQSSRNVIERVGIFEGGKARAMQRREADGETLALDTGVHAVFRPKKRAFCGVPDTALESWRDCDYCARVEPDSRCFCGFSFSEHTPDARLAGGNSDGFAWKKSLGKPAKSAIAGFSFEDHDGIPLMPCSKFRYMPSSPAQTSQMVACADAFRAGRGVPAESLYCGWYAKCRNCNRGHQEHDPESEMCPLPFNEKVGNGLYQSAWECVVCNQRWEDHETVFEIEAEYRERETMSAKQRTWSSLPNRKGAPRTPEGQTWGARASEVERLLQENSHGLSGTYRDADHYGHGVNYPSFKEQIQRENEALREQEAEILRQRKRMGDVVTYVDTTTAYKEGKGAMYGFGVGDERSCHDNFGRPSSRKARLPKVQSAGALLSQPGGCG